MSALLEAIEDERDRGLVERHQAGDDAAFSELYTLHYARLVRFCRRLVRDPHVAEELAQDAFLRAYTAVDRLGGERRFYPWLTVIARRLVIDHVRRDSRVQPHADVEPDPASATEDVVVQRLDGDHLLIALDRVRDRHRQVLHLRDWEGLSYEAIADRLGLTPTAVPPLLHRARLALRREYLLVTEGRVAAFLPLSALALALRRVRDRVAMWTSWMPDASAFSAPVAGMVLCIGTLTGALHTGPALADGPGSNRPQLAWPTAERVDAGTETERLSADTQRGLASSRDADTDTNADDVIVPGVAAGSVTQADPDGVHRVREDGRKKPIYFDSYFIGVAVDPQEERQRAEQALGTRLP